MMIGTSENEISTEGEDVRIPDAIKTRAIRVKDSLDPHKRPGRLWVGGAWVITFVFLAFGIMYSTGVLKVPYFGGEPNHFTGAYAAFAHAPGGIRTHGFLQLAIGTFLFLGVAPTLVGNKARIKYLRYVLAAGAGIYSGLTALAFLCAPFAPDGTFNGGWVHWAAFCLIAYLLALYPPRLEAPDGIHP